MITTERQTAPGMPRATSDARIDQLVTRLDLAAKVRLLTGATTWSLPAEPRIGLRPVVFSDGPVGVRGTGEGPVLTSVLMPSPTCVSATWDTDLARRIGVLFAAEARRHGVDVVLAPLVNLQRTPVSGRHFESLSEDPLLTSRLSSAFIAGVQSHGVGVCLKHFVANESETARTRYVSQVDPAVLRQVYLVPFEHAVRHVGPASVMAAYSGVDDGVEAARMTEHHHLLVDVLTTEWGYDGAIVSDWAATQSTVASARGGLDVVMPGPVGPWGDALVRAVDEGDVPESLIDDKVRRVLVLADRVGALDPEGATPPESPSSIDELDTGGADAAALAGLPRAAAAAGMVVLRTSGARLPVARAPRSIALIGPRAVDPFYQGGGSAHVTPDRVVTPSEGLLRAFPDAELELRRGIDATVHAPALDPARLRDPEGRPGIRLTQLAADGTPLASRTVAWSGRVDDLLPGAETIRLEGDVDLPEPGTHRVGLGHVGTRRLVLDGQEVERAHRVVGDDVIFDSSLDHPATSMHPVAGGRAVRLVGEFPVVHSHWGDVAVAHLRHAVPGPTDDQRIAGAVAAARRADLTVVIVGTDADVESEGWDRTSLDLPGRQNDLVRAVLAVDPEAVVVVNAGSPVLLPWLEQARTVLWAWLPGQDFGDALADVLSGHCEPAGRLPWTLPARASDVPVPDAIPGTDGRILYSEGLDVGYRSYAPGAPGASERRAAAPFGHGLGWTTWEYSGLSVGAALVPDDEGDPGFDATLTLTNTGGRAGREVVQVYAQSADHVGDARAGTARHGRSSLPTRWLAGFATATLRPGESREVTIHIPERSFQAWDAADGWSTVHGVYVLEAGRSAEDSRVSANISL